MTQKSLYTIGKLAEAAGVTPRTIRFYTAEGVLPPPEARGRYALYSDQHLHRLQLITRLKDAFLPLAAIRAQLEQLNDAQVHALLAEDYAPDPSVAEGQEQIDTLRYLAQLLRINAVTRSEQTIDAAGSQLHATSGSISAPLPAAHGRPRALLVSPRTRSKQPPLQDTAAPEPNIAAEQEHDQVDTWERIRLAPGVELHVRKPETPAARRELDRMIEDARKLFKSAK